MKPILAGPIASLFSLLLSAWQVSAAHSSCSSDLFYEEVIAFQRGGNLVLKGSTLVVGGNYDPAFAPSGKPIYVYGLNFPRSETPLTVSGQVAFDGTRIVRSWQGRVFVLERPNSVHWEDVAELLPEPGVSNIFGQSVAIDGDTIAVGSPLDADVHQGLNFVSVYRRLNGTWTPEALLTTSNLIDGAAFGHAVALSGNTLVVGDQDHQTAHIFERTGTNWSLQTRLTGAPSSAFGASVAISSNTVAVGARNEAGGFGQRGAVHIFQRLSGAWVEQAVEHGRHNYGWTVACDGDYVTASTGAAGLYFHTTVFKRNGNAWCDQGTVQGEGATISGTRLMTRDKVQLIGPVGPPQLLWLYGISSASGEVRLFAEQIENALGVASKFRRPLLAELRAAARAFDRGDSKAGVAHLRAFGQRNKQLVRRGLDISTAEGWAELAERIASQSRSSEARLAR